MDLDVDLSFTWEDFDYINKKKILFLFFVKIVKYFIIFRNNQLRIFFIGLFLSVAHSNN